MFLAKQGGRTDYNLKEFYLDSADELALIDKKSCCPGSIAYVMTTGAVYMLNSSREWILQ